MNLIFTNFYNKHTSVAWHMKNRNQWEVVRSEKVPSSVLPAAISIILIQRQRSHQRDRERKNLIENCHL